MSYYINQTECEWSIGRVIIYQITNTKNDNYYVRIRRTVGSGYFRKSLKTSNKAFAMKEAYDLWMKFLVSEALDIPYGESGFNSLFKKFFKEGGTSGAGRLKKIKSTWQTYFTGFFGQMSVMKINNKTWRAYLAYRRDYWVNREKNGQPLPTVYKKVPTIASYSSDRQILIQFLHYCVKNDYLHKVPMLDRPEKAQDIVGNVEVIGKKQTGTALPQKELNKIKAKLLHYCKTSKDKNTVRTLARWRLYYFVMICHHSLLRPSTEMTKMRWRHITIEKSNLHDDAYIAVISHNYAKWKSNRAVGEGRQRDAIMSYGGVKHLLDWREKLIELGMGVEDNDYVFPDWEGNECESHLMGRTFQNQLKKWGMRKWDGERLNNTEGINITVYSVRHSAITSLITKGKKDIGTVSTMSNTSILQISKTYYREFMLTGNKDRFANWFADGERVHTPKPRTADTVGEELDNAGFKIVNVKGKKKATTRKNKSKIEKTGKNKGKPKGKNKIKGGE